MKKGDQVKLQEENSTNFLVKYDTVNVWLQGFEKIQFQVKIEKEKLEVLQAIDTSTAAGDVNQLVSIIIKTFIRYPCLIRLIKSIREYYPLITIIVADDRSGVVHVP